MKIITCAVFLFGLSACAFLFPEEKNLFEVVPWKFIPCNLPLAPNQSCGRVPVPREQAENYDVIVGWKKFEEIVGTNSLSQEESLKTFSEFAIDQVVLLGYCKAAEIPEGSKYIFRWEGSGRHGINVACKK
jgi:hypothetical protein